MNDDRNNDQKTSADHQRELDAFENAFNGHPVDAEFAELAELATVLATISPKIDSSFAAELDQRVKDHVPAEWTTREPNRRTLADRLRAKFSGRARSLMLPVTAGLAGVLIVGTVVATGLNQNGSDSGGLDNSGSSTNLDQGSADSASSSSSSAAGASALAPATGGLSPEAEVSVPTDDANDQSLQLTTKNPGKYAYGAKKRAVAHKTEIILGTSPENVQDVSNEITSVVDNHNGIVLDSNVNDGPTGVAGATFRLLIPTGGLDSAVAELSAVADLRSRSQEATDITAPTLTVQDRLQTSRAKVKSLVNELAETTTDEDRLAVEAELLT